MKDIEEKIIECLKELKKPCYVARLVNESGETAIIISENPTIKVLGRGNKTLQQIKAV